MIKTEPLPCAQLAPDCLSVHTSWLTYSSLLWGPGCSRVRRWGAPWWPARPHLEVRRGWEKGWETSTQTEREGTHSDPAVTVSHDTKHTKKRGMLESFLWTPKRGTLWSLWQCCFCSPFLWTLCCYFQNDNAIQNMCHTVFTMYS